MLSPKDNYLRMLNGDLPEYMPCFWDNRMFRWVEEFLTPQACPNGPIVTALGVTYVGCPDLMNGAMPAPGRNLLGEDITGWRDVIKAPDLTHFDFESYYRDKIKDADRSRQIVSVGGGDYFLTLVSFMGFENLLLNLYENPDEIHEMLEYVNKFYMFILRKAVQYVKPDTLSIMDDDAALHAPFFSLEMYHEFFRPYHKMHCDVALELGIPIERHDCGKCEIFIPDWVDMGIRSWNPAQVTNDLKGIKKRYGNRLTINGGWDKLRWDSCTDMEQFRAALIEYVDTFAPGGGFVFAAMPTVKPGDPLSEERSRIIHDVYDNYAKDYYKTH